MGKRRYKWCKRLAAGAALAVSFSVAIVQPVAAHLAGQPSFLKVNDSFVDYYPVKKPSTTYIDIPQSTDINRHAPGEAIWFEIDKKLLSVSFDNVDKMSFDWEFGDGAKASGQRVRHAYAEAGTYHAKIHGTVDGRRQLIESTALYILPDTSFQRPRVYVSVNGQEVRNDTQELAIAPGQAVSLSARLDPGSTSGYVESYQWDFGDGVTDSGQTVQHTYDAAYTQAYPVVRAVVDGRYSTDNSAWLSNPDAPAPGVADWYDGLKRRLDTSLGGVFSAAGINYPLALLILSFAVVAGALHSLTPGHGKTVLAALLVGRQNNKYRDLAILTVSITVAHTAVIYGIGFVFLAFNSSQSVNSIIPYFEKASAALVFVLALYLLWTGARRWFREWSHRRAHQHGHEHGHSQSHDHAKDVTAARQRGDSWSLVVAGAGGGIIPCIDALSLMLLAAGLGHVGFGLVIVLFFSIGLAGTIAGIGLLLLAGKRLLLLSDRTEQRVYLYAPLVSGSIILLLAVLLVL